MHPIREAWLKAAAELCESAIKTLPFHNKLLAGEALTEEEKGSLEKLARQYKTDCTTYEYWVVRYNEHKEEIEKEIEEENKEFGWTT